MIGSQSGQKAIQEIFKNNFCCPSLKPKQKKGKIIMTKQYSEDISKFYGLNGGNNDIMEKEVLINFVEQVKNLIQKGMISKDEANQVFLAMLLTHGDNEATFPKDLFTVKCNVGNQITAPRPFWRVVDNRKGFNDFVSGLYGDWSSNVSVRYLTSIGKMSIILVTETEEVISGETLEFNYELKNFVIIREDKF